MDLQRTEGYQAASDLRCAPLPEGIVTDSAQGNWLLASDLDGTLIPAQARAGAGADILRFREFVESGVLRVAYATGRHLELALEGIAEHGLPLPDAIATDVGTALYWRTEEGFVRDEAYDAFVASVAGAPDAVSVRRALEGVPGLRLQEEARQAVFKVSYRFDGIFSQRVLDDLGSRLDEVGRTRLVHSRDPVEGVGLLDVLPADVGKETAVGFLRARFDQATEVLYSGDSGNDRDAILCGCRSIVVGNAPEPLRHELRARAAELGLQDLVFFARRSDAAGVLEGLAHHGVVALT